MPATWTYDPANLATSAKDQVRLLVGDTEENDPLMQDAEITYFLSIESGTFFAAARAAEAIAALFARKVNTQIGDLRLGSEKKYEHYAAMAIDLRTRAASQDCAPYAGGISIADKQGGESDTDRVPPFFTRRDGANPQAGVRPPLSTPWPMYP